MKKKAFTLIEILITVVVIGILATVAFPSYLNTIENSKAKVCETNLRALQIALDAYLMEHDAVPASLSQIPSFYIEKAYASLLKEKDAWKIKLAYFVVQWQARGLAYAAPLIKDLAAGDTRLVVCPADSDVAGHGGISYGINNAIAGKTVQDYQNLASTVTLIGDADLPAFSDETALTGRHKEYKILQPVKKYARAIRKNKQIIRLLK